MFPFRNLAGLLRGLSLGKHCRLCYDPFGKLIDSLVKSRSMRFAVAAQD